MYQLSSRGLDQTGVSAIYNRSPFNLDNETEYQRWKSEKLHLVSSIKPSRVVSVSQSFELGGCSPGELERQVRAFNFVKYQLDQSLDPSCQTGFMQITRHFGLNQIDTNLGAESSGISELMAVSSDDRRAQYIPYTKRALNWHTDGYYNPSNRSIAAFALHCVHPAIKGGSNFIFDHELMYMKIRDTSAELIEALMDVDLMLIPANVQQNQVIRRQQSGPVFSVDNEDGRLRMRYSARPRNIGWKKDKLSERAVSFVREILMDDEMVVRLRLEAGQGIVCNNLLHGRNAFIDGENGASRLYYRARFQNPISIKHLG